MNPRQLRRLRHAPELLVVNVLNAALNALRVAMLAEHPLADDEGETPHDPPIQRRARRLLRLADRLGQALKDYRREVWRVLPRAGQKGDAELPF